MKVVIVKNSPELETVPLYKIALDESSNLPYQLVLEFDDVNEERWKIIFDSYQAVIITPSDCFNTEIYAIEDAATTHKKYGKYYNKYIFEVIDSPWISDLDKKSKMTDPNADFMKKSHHYIFPFGDYVLEIAAWDNFILEKL